MVVPVGMNYANKTKGRLNVLLLFPTYSKHTIFVTNFQTPLCSGIEPTTGQTWLKTIPRKYPQI